MDSRGDHAEVDRARSVALARLFIERVAPEELPLFPDISGDYLANRAVRSKPRDDVLGFGTPEAVALLTPAAFAVAAEVLRYCAAHMPEKTAEWLRLPGGHEHGEDSRQTPNFTREQLAEIRRVVLDEARKLKLDQSKALALANGVVVQLSLGDL
jgi:hypothetical protein